LCCQVFLSLFLAFYFHDTWYFFCKLCSWFGFFIGSVNIQELFFCRFLIFITWQSKIKPSKAGSCNKMFGNAMYFVAWYTLPFFRELNLYFYKFNFFVF
jgi:hypothetical protein